MIPVDESPGYKNILCLLFNLNFVQLQLILQFFKILLSFPIVIGLLHLFLCLSPDQSFEMLNEKNC